MILETEQQSVRPSHQLKPSLWGQLWSIALVALALRLTVVFFLAGDQLDPTRDHWIFGWETGRIARSLASGHGFGSPLLGDTGATAWMAPVYPCLLAGIFKIFGIYSKPSAYLILSLNSLFAALTCQPLHAIAHRLSGGTAATAVAWTWALFPYSVNFAAGMVWSTALNTLPLALAISMTLALERRFGSWNWVVWGGFWL